MHEPPEVWGDRRQSEKCDNSLSGSRPPLTSPHSVSSILRLLRLHPTVQGTAFLWKENQSAWQKDKLRRASGVCGNTPWRPRNTLDGMRQNSSCSGSSPHSAPQPPRGCQAPQHGVSCALQGARQHPWPLPTRCQ